MRSVLVLAATALSGAATSWWLGRTEAAPATPPSSSREHSLPTGSSREDGTGLATAQVEALRRELEALRQQNQRLAQRMDSVGALAHQAPAPPEPSVSPPALSPQEAEARFASKRAAYFGRLETAFQQQARESTWAPRTESLIDGLLRQESNQGAHLERLDCRTHLCRIELSHPDGETWGSVVEQLIATPGLQGELIVQRLDAEQPPRTVIYVARDGMPLPRGGAEGT
jgi:hypothetical protein